MSATLRFDPFELQTTERRLLHAGQPVALGARAFDVLVVLAEHAGSLVTKAELLDRVWSGLVVEENNIAAQVAALRKAIGGEFIATVPGRGYRFSAPVQRVDAAPAGAAAAPPATTPAVAYPGARLFGREDDSAALEAALALPGCVTLVGPAGVGKTVLAQAVAARQQPAPPWLDLAVLTTPAQLPAALFRSLGITPPVAGAAAADVAAALATGLAGQRLLVMDNAEHLIDGVAALVQQLLAAAPQLSLLVTSQLPLRLPGETVLQLQPLALPPADLPDEGALAAGAVAMLVHRIHAVDHRFPLGAAAVPLLRQLSQRLDGLPLALEMAAARVPLLGLQGVLDGLDQRFALLTRGPRGTSERHKTLHAAVEWSHALLEPAEQRLFRRLGVFANGFTLELAVAVGGDSGAERWETVDLLSSLVERSLVASQHVDPPRYRLLETMRSFALEQLLASGEDSEVRQRLLAALTTLMQNARERAGHGDAEEGRRQGIAELGNAREALQWAHSHATAGAVALALESSAHATWSAWRGEAADWIEACEPLLGDDVPLALQAAWWTEMARQQSFNRGTRTVEASLRASDLQRQLGNEEGLFWALIPLLRSRLLDAEHFEACRTEAQALLDRNPAWPLRPRVVLEGSVALEYRRRGDFETALVHQRTEFYLATQLGVRTTADNARINLAGSLLWLHRHQEALQLMDELLQQAGSEPTTAEAQARVQRLYALIGLGRLADAQEGAAKALAWCQRFSLDDSVFQALAVLASQQGRHRAAVQWIGRFRRVLQTRHGDVPDEEHAPWRQVMALAEQQLDPSTVQSLLDRGARMDAALLPRLLTEDAPGSAHTGS